MPPETPTTPREERPADTAAPVASPARLGLKEIALAGLGLGVVAMLVYISHILNGGFYSDDWADAAARYYPPGEGAWRVSSPTSRGCSNTARS